MASPRRLFNELEQTPTGYGINLGTKNLQIINSKDFKDAYAAAFKIFGAEAHHIIDLAWVDRTLGAAGLSPESRSYVIEQLNKHGIYTGNHPLNISPQPQERPKYGRTGKAHKWVHDLYKQIPSAETVFNVDDISQLSEDQLVEYMVEAGRMRKQIVVDAMTHKLDSLMQAVPESINWSSDQIRDFANKNKKMWGSLGDDTFKHSVQLPDPSKIGTVKGRPRGNIPIRPDVEQTLLGRNLGYLGDTGVNAAVLGAKQLLKDAPVGTALGAAGSLQDPKFQQAIEEGDLLKAGQVAGRDFLIGTGLDIALKEGAIVLQKLSPTLAANVSKLAPVLGVIGNAVSGVGIATLAPSSVDPQVQKRQNEAFRFKQTSETVQQISDYKDQQIPTQNGKYGPDMYQEPDPFLNAHLSDRKYVVQQALKQGPRMQLCLKNGTICVKPPELGISEAITGVFKGQEERKRLNGR